MKSVWEKSIGVYFSEDPPIPSQDYRMVFKEIVKKDIDEEYEKLVFHAMCHFCKAEFEDATGKVCVVGKKGEQLAYIPVREVVFFALKCPKCNERCRITGVTKLALSRQASIQRLLGSLK